MQPKIIALKKEEKLTDAQHTGFFEAIFSFRKNKMAKESARNLTYHFTVVKMRDDAPMTELKEKSLVKN